MSEQSNAQLAQKAAEEPYAKLLQLDVREVSPGHAVVAMTNSPEKANLFGMLHGGAVFSLLDEAFQLACNAAGEFSVALQVSINYVAAAAPGAVLLAEVSELNSTRRTGLYQATVTQEDGKLLATGQALAYRKGGPLPLA